jgi:3-hydroxyisobutyrate dehydrogenase-like beta-hydroxyacid dehydrogenase
MFLASTTEQILFSSAAAGNGLLDDSKLIKVYSPEQPNIVLESSSISSSDNKGKLDLVKKLMKAVNLAVAAEAMSLGKRVGLSVPQLYDIIKGAAGGSWVFQNRVPDLISGGWKQNDGGKSVSEVVKDLVSLSFLQFRIVEDSRVIETI